LFPAFFFGVHVFVSALLLAASTASADPCALRDLVGKPAKEIAPLVDKAAEGRARACMNVVLAVALAREGKGSDAVKRFDAAADALPEIANAIELAKKRATSSPNAPAKDAQPKTREEAAQLIMKLVREAKPKRAVEVAFAFEKAAPPEFHEAFEVATLTALVRADRHDDAVKRGAAVVQQTPGIVKARAWVFSKARRYAEARDLYATVKSDDPAVQAEAAFLSAFSAYEGGDHDDAKKRFTAALPAVKDSVYAGSTRWYIAFCDILRGKWKDAVPTLQALVSELPDEREALKHRYWLARARIESGDKKGGKAELSKVSEEPIEYYGILARKRLGRAPIKGTKVAADAMAKLAKDDDKVLLLWGIGLDDEARTLARSLGEDAPAIGLQHKVNDATYGWRRGAKFIPFPRTSGGALSKSPNWRVSYASPWLDVVEASAAKHGAASSFVYAIMRTESGFDPRAVSVAGALGVIQLLPSASRGSATLAGRPVEDANRIFEPEIAIDLGTALLGTGQREFGSQMLSAAAYNGGAHNVALWMKEYRALETELFIERIPFKETRDYVKRVTAVEAVYRGLNGGDVTPNLPDSIPEPPEKFTHFPMDE
jgi:soluble lytic murein transglycosylase-like protein